MINPLLDGPRPISTLLVPNPLRFINMPPSITPQQTLLEAILHMCLGLPSQTFPISNHTFSLEANHTQLSHISSDLLSSHLSELVVLGNKLQDLRKWITELYHIPHSIVQAFGVGLQDIRQDIEEKLCSKLTLLHQEMGDLQRSAPDCQQQKGSPLSMIGLTFVLQPEQDQLAVICSIMSTYPSSDPPNMDELNRWTVYLLNFYFQQVQKEHLSGRLYNLHTPFQSCLSCYLSICKAWACFDEKALQLCEQTGFFINLTKALSLNGERFFKITKIVYPELIPSFLEPHYKQLIELGKTVQFIKFYLSEEDLLFFFKFLATDQEFTPLFQFISTPPSTSKPQSKTKFTISGRCQDKSKSSFPRGLQQQEEGPFGTEPHLFPFVSLRKSGKASLGRVLPGENGEKCAFEEDGSKSSSRSGRLGLRSESCSKKAVISSLLGDVLESMSLKCKIVMKEHKIKDRILEALKAIKDFVLLGKGDFLQEFLELSQPLLERPTDKISHNNLHNLIEEAAKASSCHKLYQSIKEELSFVFLRGETSRVKGWRSFSLTYRSRPPVSFIFHGEAMHDYQCVGNFLFSLRKCQHVLVSFWRKSFLVGSAPLQHLRTAVHRLVSSIETYLFSTIEDFWGEFQTVFEPCYSVLELLEANNTFLSRLKEVSTENRALSNAMLSLLKLVEQLQSLWLKMEEGQIESLGRQIRQLWEWFMSLLDQARQLQPLANSLNFDFAVLRPSGLQ